MATVSNAIYALPGAILEINGQRITDFAPDDCITLNYVETEQIKSIVGGGGDGTNSIKANTAVTIDINVRMTSDVHNILGPLAESTREVGNGSFALPCVLSLTSLSGTEIILATGHMQSPTEFKFSTVEEMRKYRVVCPQSTIAYGYFNAAPAS